MAGTDDLTAHEVIPLVHSHAAQFMVSDPRLSPKQAIRRAADLAVLAYDNMRLASVLRDAAASQKVPSLLADLIAPEGGATLALAATAGVEDDAL